MTINEKFLIIVGCILKGENLEIEEIRGRLLHDEAACWDKIQELRSIDIPSLLEQVRVDSNTNAIKRGVHAVKKALDISVSWGLNLETIEPGHGIGHIVRDYVNSLRLLNGFDGNPRDAFVGFVAGVLHDLSCGLIERYEEPYRAVRHAEAGAILMMELEGSGQLGVSAAEAKLIQYAIAAHTHYLKPNKVLCGDGVEREVIPYGDTDPSGNPYMFVWLPRWVDRLDCSGVTMVGRHFLTLGKEHEDYSALSSRHYTVTFHDHMQPLLRSEQEIGEAGGKRTMVEHLAMFANSQTNSSPYGRFDSGKMFLLRDEERKILLRIIEATQQPKPALFQQDTLQRWERFLQQNIEPTRMGRRVATQLCQMFKQLEEPARNHWCNGFEVAMKVYSSWSANVLRELADLPEEYLLFPPFFEKLRIFI